MKRNKLVIGLTGGIGCGKSSVSDIFRSLGAYIIDGDIISRNITETNEGALQEIKQAFGDEVFNQNESLNRKKLGEIVFSNKVKLETLNSIMFRYVKNEIKIEIAKICAIEEYKYIILDGAILFEMGLDKECDVVCAVSADKNSQIERIMKRNKLTYEEALGRINSQISVKELIKKCDYTIENTGKIEELRNKVLQFFEYVNNVSNEGLK